MEAVVMISPNSVNITYIKNEAQNLILVIKSVTTYWHTGPPLPCGPGHDNNAR